MELFVCLSVISFLLVFTLGVSYLQKRRNMRTAAMILISILLWSAIAAIAYTQFNIPDNEPDTTNVCADKTDCTSDAPCCLGKLKIYSQGNTHYAEMDREEALKFGLEKIDTTINYLFIAVAGILTLLGKIIIDPLTQKEKNKYQSPWILWLIANCAMLCAASVAAGFFARLYFTSIGNERWFSIYGEIGAGMNLQIILFLTAFILLVITIIAIVSVKNKN